MIPSILTEKQARVVGSIIEKQITTPANYPMTPNSVRVACNQKSNRDPVVDYDDDEIFDTLKALEKAGCVESGLLDYTRTIKYRQVFTKVYGLDRAGTAVVCELLVRGPQTPGELRSRCERMHPFGALAEVQGCLDFLAGLGYVVMLDRVSGTKENRWAHLFCGKPTIPVQSPVQAVGSAKSVLEDRVAALETQVLRLEQRLEALEGRISL